MTSPPPGQRRTYTSRTANCFLHVHLLAFGSMQAVEHLCNLDPAGLHIMAPKLFSNKVCAGLHLSRLLLQPPQPEPCGSPSRAFGLHGELRHPGSGRPVGACKYSTNDARAFLLPGLTVPARSAFGAVWRYTTWFLTQWAATLVSSCAQESLPGPQRS